MTKREIEQEVHGYKSIDHDRAGMFDSFYPNLTEKCMLLSKDNLYTSTRPLGLNHVFIIFFIL